jgi:hypothetical protein
MNYKKFIFFFFLSLTAIFFVAPHVAHAQNLIGDQSGFHILTPAGYKTLSQIKAGDQVAGYDFQANQKVTNIIERIDISTRNANDFYIINGIYHLYKNQSVWINSGTTARVVHTFEIKVGDSLYNDNEQPIKITSIQPFRGETSWIEFIISGNHSYIANGLVLHNASRYWVGGGSSVNWNATANTNWGSASNTQDNSSVPTSTDDVFFDGVGTGNSNSTLSAAISIRSLNMNGYAKTLTGNDGGSLNIGDSTAGAGNVALYFGSGQTNNWVGLNHNVNLVSTSATQQTITSNGKKIIQFNLNGAGGSWQLQDALTLDATSASNNAFTWTAGTLDTNGQKIIIDAGGTFTGGGKTYFELDCTGIGCSTISGTNTFTNFKINTDGNNNNYVVPLAANQTVTGTLTIAGNSATNRVMLESSVVGTQHTITNTGATMVLSNADFMDVALSNTYDASGIAGGSGDCGGNSNITFTTGANQFWKTTTTGSKNWSTTADWFLGTNGTGGAGHVPLCQDTAIFDGSSIGAASTTIVADMPRMGGVNWTGVTHTPTWSFTGASNLLIMGNVTVVGSSSMTLTGTVPNVAFGTRSSQSITSNGNTFTVNITINAPGGTVTIADNFIDNRVGGVAFALLFGTLTVNNVNFQVDDFGTNTTTTTRAINMGSGTWTLTGNNTTIFAASNDTGLTINEGNPIVCNYSGSTGTRTILGPTLSSANILSFNITAGSDTVSLGSSGDFYDNLDFTGSSVTLATFAPTGIKIYGNLTLSSGMTLTSNGGVVTFAATSGTKTITSNTKTMDFPVTFDGIGGTWNLGDNMTVGSTRTVTLNNGFINANGHNFSMGLFSSSNSNTRGIIMGTGTWTLTGNAATIWTTSTNTNLTVSLGNPIVCNYSGSTGTRTITVPATESGAPSFNITAGSDTVAVNPAAGSLDFTGFTGTWTNSTVVLYGSLTVSSGMTVNAGANSVTFASTSRTPRTITTNGKTLDFPITLNGIGGTWNLGDNLTVGSTRTVTLTNGAFNANGKNFSMGLFSSTNSNHRQITLGSGTWTLTGTGTVWTTSTTTNLTFTQGTSTIVVNDATAAAKTFTGGGLTFNNVTFSGDNITVSGANTFNTLAVNTAGLTNGLILTHGVTQTVTNLTTNGFASNLAKLKSDSAGSAATISKASGVVSVDYMSIKDSTATGGASFFAGANSSSVSGNTGWTFSDGATNKFWIGGAGNWSDTSHWSGQSGGVGGSPLPTSSQNVLFDSNSGTGTATIDTASVTVTDLNDSSANITIATSSNGITVAGNLTVNGTLSGATAVTLSGSGKTIFGTGTLSAPQTISGNQTVDSTSTLAITGTTTINNSIVVTNNGSPTVSNLGSGTGTWTQGSNSVLTYLGTGSVTPTLTATASGNTVNYTGDGATTIKNTTYYNLQVGNAQTQAAGRTYTLGGDTTVSNALTVGPALGSFTQTLAGSTFTLTLSGTGTVFSMQNKGSYNAGTSTISITDTSSSSKTFAGAGKTYGNLSITGAGTGAVIFTGANTFANFTINAPKTVTFPANNVTTITGTFTATGSSGNVITINSSASGTQAVLSKASGTVSVDWVSLKDSKATGGALFYAGANSTNVSGNTGWVFAVAVSTLNQEHFRFFLDDGGLNAADPAVAQDTNYNVGVGNIFRLRIEVANTGNTPVSITRRLEFQEDSGAWTQITTNSNNVRLAVSGNFVDGAATTPKLTAVGIFTAGQGKDTGSDTSSLSLTNGYNVEDEYSLILQSGAAGHSYSFRITNAGTVLDTYSVTPTVNTPDNTPPTPSGFNPATGATIKTATPTITFTLNENGDCKASTTNASYDAMSGAVCSAFGGTNMSCTMPSLGSNGSKTIFFACEDQFANKDTSLTTHSVTYTLNLSSGNTPTLGVTGNLKLSGGLIIK